MEIKIQKALSQLGMASRRGAEEMIRQGRVTVNGNLAKIGMRIDPEKVHIKVDGRLVSALGQKVYYLFYKPIGVVSTLSDPQGRRCISDFIGHIEHRLFSVGRLDYNSEGLMILTNDGELANRILHPSSKIPKTYHVKVSDEPSESAIERLRKGIVLEDGKTAPAKAKVMRRAESNTWMEIVIHEGRKRQIRRMIEAIGHKVMKLRRVMIDGLSLDGLRPGQIRPMTHGEEERIKRQAK